MISLKKYIESNPAELLQPVLESYRAALSAIGSAGVQACPPVGATLQASLGRLQQQLSDEPTPARILEAEAGVEKGLDEWAQQTADYYRQRTKEFKELLLAMASTAEAVGERDTRYQAALDKLSGRLAEIADLQDLTHIRSSLLTSAADLKSCVERMAQDSRETVAQLRAEVKKCQTRIEEVERIEVVDRLTGLANRQAMESAIAFQLAQKRRFCLMMLDLTGFKAVNDAYGQRAGDQLLKQFAAELKGAYPLTNSVGRWAGDEFAVVIYGSAKEANIFADNVKRWVFGDYTVEDTRGKRKVHIEAALVVTECQPGESLAALLGRVDKSMAEQKKLRRR